MREGVRGGNWAAGATKTTWRPFRSLLAWPLFWVLGCKFRPRRMNENMHRARRACSPWGAALLVLSRLNCHFSRLFWDFFRPPRPVILWGARAQVASAPRQQPSKKYKTRTSLFCAGVFNKKIIMPATVVNFCFHFYRRCNTALISKYICKFCLFRDKQKIMW